MAARSPRPVCVATSGGRPGVCSEAWAAFLVDAAVQDGRRSEAVGSLTVVHSRLDALMRELFVQHPLRRCWLGRGAPGRKCARASFLFCHEYVGGGWAGVAAWARRVVIYDAVEASLRQWSVTPCSLRSGSVGRVVFLPWSSLVGLPREQHMGGVSNPSGNARKCARGNELGTPMLVVVSEFIQVWVQGPSIRMLHISAKHVASLTFSGEGRLYFCALVALARAQCIFPSKYQSMVEEHVGSRSGDLLRYMGRIRLLAMSMHTSRRFPCMLALVGLLCVSPS